ncbi:DedA family protein [Cellulomonas sp. S1-8]|uniref:DedA family protein n=1 Tax=Cellulomonas sp. S1-8 TaxID=2904790 RepID=UPI002243F5AA|nr:DedA family protein [Cellulomonas sp. S1-8]UZN02215.1 DedA family protein [Cellulomonas sp. S1-8]
MGTTRGDHVLEQWVLDLAASPWVFAALFGFATIDGFFPPIPSESVVIALASLSTSTGSPLLWGVVLVAALGAFVGDQIAYQIGTVVRIRELRVFQGRRGHALLDWAERALLTRGAAFIIAARYIPVGRVAVNMTAGALGFRRRRFVLLTAIAALSWALYSTAIGIGTGAVLGDSPLVGVVAGVVGGFVIGLGVDWVLRRWLGFTARTVPTAATVATAADGTAADEHALAGGVPVDAATAGAEPASPRSEGTAA